MTETFVYLYAILERPVNLVSVHGIDGGRLRWIQSHKLAAAVSDVPAEEFEEEPLNEHVRDMAWLGPKAVAHQNVNSALFEASEAIVPLAFGTVFRDDERVRQSLMQQTTKLSHQLQRVRGAAEWVVALHLLQEPDVTEVSSVKELRKQIEASPPGRAHLLRQRLASLERDEARHLKGETSTQVYEALSQVAQEVFREPLSTDVVERPLLRASVLVPRAAEAAFTDEVDRLRLRWPEPTYRLLLTGPWPPYRFGGLQRDAV